MAVLNLAPTRSNLLLVKGRLGFAREGLDILKKKREVLTVQLLQSVSEAESLQASVWALLAEAYRALEHARLSMGQERVEWAAMAVTRSVDVSIVDRGMMGVPLPRIEAHGQPPAVSYSLGDTSVTLDEATEAFRNVLDQVPGLTEIVVSVWRLARDLKKTQRRVHALEKIYIPTYVDTIRYIENILEEQDREEIFLLKWLKSHQEEKENSFRSEKMS